MTRPFLCHADDWISYYVGGMLKAWPQGFPERLEPRMREGLSRVRSLFAQMPMDWLHVDGDATLPVQFDLERVISALELPFEHPEHFWKLP